MKKIVVVGVLFLSLFVSGCIETEEDWFLDTIAVSRNGDVALCLDKEGGFIFTGDDTEVYITDLKGSFFTQVTEEEVDNNSVSWSDNGKILLYTEEGKGVEKLNLYSVSEGTSDNLLEEMHCIGLPRFSSDIENIAYMVFPDDFPVGNLNIYERDSFSIYTIVEYAYCDYKWIPGAQEVVAVNVVEQFDELFHGRLIIKNVEEITEEEIFDGYFDEGGNTLDISGDGRTIIFAASEEESSETGIYLYNIGDKTISKWSGPEGYEFRLPDFDLGGYILANIKGEEEDEAGPSYLVSLDKKIIEVPGCPVWIKLPYVVYIDLDEGKILVLNQDTGEIVNLTEKFLAYCGKEED